MYKVFINDKPIILTDSLVEMNNFFLSSFENVVLEEIIHKLKFETIEGVILHCKDLQYCWTIFKSHFVVVIAAGGLVVNHKNEFLFIYRGNKWDLPKGRIEENENLEQTAIREVEEECGISNLEVQQFLTTTFHIFYQDHIQKLKETHWYLMSVEANQTLTPQLEEGITDVAFKDHNQTKIALQDTYANIQSVFEKYYQLG